MNVDHAPILASARPFSGNVYHGKVEYFEQAVISWENGLGFGHFPQLAVKALNGVDGIDQQTYLLWVLEISAQMGPVVLPGTGNLGVFLVPMFRKNLQRVQGGSLIHRHVYRLKKGGRCYYG